jgi:hypothetical protein
MERARYSDASDHFLTEVRMALRIIHSVAIAAAMSICLPCAAQEIKSQGQPHRVAGEKLDNGLGRLPHYREWHYGWNTNRKNAQLRLNPVVGEKLDSGLGELQPHRVHVDVPATATIARIE